MSRANPVLILLPHGLIVSGVAVWAVRLANLAARAGHPVGLVVHQPAPGYAPLDLEIDPRVAVTRVDEAAPLDQAADHAPIARQYANAFLALGPTPERPALVVPNLLGACFGLVARLMLTFADRARVIAWQHNDIPYDRAVLSRYEPMISAFVPVSRAIEADLRAALPAPRGQDIVRIPYGVPLTNTRPARSDKNRPLRVLYAGRLADEQKRISVIEHLADRIESSALDIRLTIVGDGPQAERVHASVAGMRTVSSRPGCTPNELETLRHAHDVFVLSSRFEGLSIAMLEALAAGLVPVVTRVRSGAAEVLGEALGDGGPGVLIEPEGSDEQTADLMLAALERFARDPAMLEEHRRLALEQASGYSLDRHAQDVSDVFARAATSEPRWWPGSLPTDDSVPVHASGGSVPHDAVRRCASALDELSAEGARSLIIYGAGAHTRALAPALARSTVPVDAVIDDAAEHEHPGTLWGWPTHHPEDAAVAAMIGDGAAVLISSWLHQDAMAERAETLFGANARVKRLYSPQPTAAEIVR